MNKESCFNDNVVYHTKLDSPVLFVLMGERGKEIFPLVQRVKNSIGESIQILQICENNLKLASSQAEFVDISSETMEDDIQNVLGKFIIPAMKYMTYGRIGMAYVNFVVDISEKDADKLDVISNKIHGCMESAFQNDVGFQYFCIADVEFENNQEGKRLTERFNTLGILNSLSQNNSWVRMVYVVSNLNAQDVFLSNNMEKKYLSIVLNTFIQAGSHNIDNKWNWGFEPESYAEKMKIDGQGLFQTMGCSLLQLDKELITNYFKWKFMEYLRSSKGDKQGMAENIFVSQKNTVEGITKELFEKLFSDFPLGAEHISYNGKVKLSSLIGSTNSNCLYRFYADNLNDYIYKSVQNPFLIQQRVALAKNNRNYEKEFVNAFQEGEINPFHMEEFEKLKEKLREDIKGLEQLKAKEIEKKMSWLNKTVKTKRMVIFKRWYVDKIRRKILRTRMNFERAELLLEGQIRYLHMQADCIMRILEMASDYRNAFKMFSETYQSAYMKIKQGAFTYQTERFEEYYSGKIEDTLMQKMTECEVEGLYKAVCDYMLNETNSLVSLEMVLDEFFEKFWKQGDFKEELTEEIEERMIVTSDSNRNAAFVSIYQSACEAHNVNLRVLDVQSGRRCDVCCFMGPSDNAFINFLQKQKYSDSRVKVQIVEQLRIPVVLYYEFNILENSIKI